MHFESVSNADTPHCEYILLKRRSNIHRLFTNFTSYKKIIYRIKLTHTCTHSHNIHTKIEIESTVTLELSECVHHRISFAFFQHTKIISFSSLKKRVFVLLSCVLCIKATEKHLFDCEACSFFLCVVLFSMQK